MEPLQMIQLGNSNLHYKCLFLRLFQILLSSNFLLDKFQTLQLHQSYHSYSRIQVDNSYNQKY